MAILFVATVSLYAALCWLARRKAQGASLGWLPHGAAASGRATLPAAIPWALLAAAALGHGLLSPVGGPTALLAGALGALALCAAAVWDLGSHMPQPPARRAEAPEQQWAIVEGASLGARRIADGLYVTRQASVSDRVVAHLPGAAAESVLAFIGGQHGRIEELSQANLRLMQELDRERARTSDLESRAARAETAAGQMQRELEAVRRAPARGAGAEADMPFARMTGGQLAAARATRLKEVGLIDEVRRARARSRKDDGTPDMFGEDAAAGA